MIQKAWTFKMVRFVSVGVVNTGLDFLMLNILVFVFNVEILFANTISVCIGVTISYFLNHHVVFQNQNKTSMRMYMKFFIITGLSILCVQTTVIYLTTPIVTRLVAVLAGGIFSGIGQFTNNQEQVVLNISKALAVVAGMAWNYLLYSKIVFANKNERQQGS